MDKTALLIIDMQKAFFNNEALEKDREKLIKNCNQLINYCKGSGAAVFNIVTEHKRDKSTWTLNMLEDGEGYLFEGDADTENLDGLEIQNSTKVIKTRDSAFHETDLAQILQDRKIANLILCGVSTHSCIMLTAADAYALNFEVIIAKDAVGSHDPGYHEPALRLLQQEYRQQIKDCATILT